MYAALTQKHQESLNYYAEIERLNGVLEEYKSKASIDMSQHSKPAVVVNEKVVNDNSNEIIVLKARIRDAITCRRVISQHFFIVFSKALTT